METDLTGDADKSGLKKKVIGGLAWTSVARIGQQFGWFITTVILARLLTPADFGLIAMIAVFNAIASTFVDSGFSESLIQKQDVDDVDTSSIFYFNIAVAVALWFVLLGIAPYVGRFYSQPELGQLLPWTGLSIILGAFGLVQRKLLTKELKFAADLKATWASIVVGASLAIACAIAGFGVWSLVIKIVATQATYSAALWYLHPWRPKLCFDVERLSRHFPFSSKLLAVKLVDSLFDNIYLIVIGKYYSVDQLGHYRQADSMKQIPVFGFAYSLNRVLFPVFSRIQFERDRIARALRASFKTTCILIAPLMATLIATADPLIPLVLGGDKWRPAIPLFQLLCIVGAFFPVQAANRNVLKAIGRMDLFLRMTIVTKVLLVLTILCTLPFGIYTMIWGHIGHSIVSFFINAWYTGQLFRYGPYAQMIDAIPPILIATVVGFSANTIGSLGFSNDIWRLLTQFVVAGVLYLCCIGCVYFSALRILWREHASKLSKRFIKVSNTSRDNDL